MKGTLTLIPTPIDEAAPLEPVALARLKAAAETAGERSHFVIEDLRPGRRRWLQWGLPRDRVENFILYNEHTEAECAQNLKNLLLKGQDVYLMSDGGLPAFCDPGRVLVDLCHQSGIKVTATPFPHSIALALALSGFNHDRYYFAGFPPIDKDARAKALNEAINFSCNVIMMDTPYRMRRLIEELKQSMDQLGRQRPIFLGMDLNTETEALYRGEINHCLNTLTEWKREFILILGGK